MNRMIVNTNYKLYRRIDHIIF